MLGRSIGLNSIALGVFAAIMAAILALTFGATETRILASEKKAAQKALFELVPETRHNNDMLTETLSIPKAALALLNESPESKIHIAKQDGNSVALVIPTTAPDGYSGAIKMIVGVNIDGTLAGVRVIAHKETPGLGDKVDLNKDDWVLSFEGKSLVNPNIDKWAVKKDGGEFDQFTGATITPRAVVNKVKHVLEFYAANKSTLVLEHTNDQANNL